MNRTEVVAAFALSCILGVAPTQEPAKGPPGGAQADPIDGIVAAMRDAERRAKSFRLELSTVGQLPGGLELTTKGVLHVLRGAQPAVHSAVEFSFADGLSGRMESAQTKAGIVLFEDDPAAGELFLHIDPATVADLEWAGTVLERADLPGMVDGRAVAPLGSAMVADLRRRFALALAERKDRDGEPGRWLVGPRSVGVEDKDPDVPVADKVELFIRDADHALLEVRHLLGDKVVQRLDVKRVEVDVDLPAKAFVVDGGGQRLREVHQHAPMWNQIEQVLRQAEAKAVDKADGKAEPEVRPSRR